MIENLPDVYDTINFDNHLRVVEPYFRLSEEDKNHKLIELVSKEGRQPVKTYGNHHQAIDPKALGSGIKILLVWKLPRGYVPYALYDNTYAPGVWLTQFHPEVKEELGGAMARSLSNLNSEIFDSFFRLMKPKGTRSYPAGMRPKHQWLNAYPAAQKNVALPVYP